MRPKKKNNLIRNINTDALQEEEDQKYMHPKKKIRNISLNEGVDACGNIALIWNVSAENAAYIQVISFVCIIAFSYWLVWILA